MNSVPEALGMVLAMGAVIFFCRAFPFMFFSRNKGADNSTDSNSEKGGIKRLGGISRLVDFAEKIIPPVAMTVLSFNILGTSFKADQIDGLLVLGASAITAGLHLWKRNFLISILGGTAVYMILCRFL
jgi:branched-subunit amino acid transport protein AzlD